MRSANVWWVILESGSNRLRATTVAIDDPGPLQRFLPLNGPSTAFIRKGEGIITIGEVDRFETDYPDAADVWWNEVASYIDHDSELPGAYGTGPLAVGSFTFDPDASEERSVLIVPRVIIGRRAGQFWMTKLTGGKMDYELPDVGEALVPPTDVQLDDGPVPPEDWGRIVAEVVGLIHADEVSKVVLARKVRARSAAPIDGRTILNRLLNRYPTTWAYMVDGLVGATPELLIRRQGGLATSRVLAGTISLDPDHTDPLARAADLARSRKDISEHEFAVESIAHALEPFCSAMNVPESPSVLPLPNVLHLATDITGVTDPDTSSLALAAALHPSAAVCGTPTFLAREVIGELESMDRGRYAGPIGWVDARGDGEWALALRGGQILRNDPREIHLFAGAGVVADSDPDAEIAETNAKLLPMLQALGLSE
ncbi:chorismate-binding protein [Tessaracoccus terricola]